MNTTRALLQKLQPGVPVFNGCGLVPNAVAWIGSESGHATAPVWDSADSCADIPTNGAPLGSAWEGAAVPPVAPGAPLKLRAPCSRGRGDQARAI